MISLLSRYICTKTCDTLCGKIKKGEILIMHDDYYLYKDNKKACGVSSWTGQLCFSKYNQKTLDVLDSL